VSQAALKQREVPLSVDVVIPVYGQWELTANCLASLATRDTCVRRVIVVDDKSPDDSAAQLRTRTDIVAVILSENAGFARACNAGARAGDADAIFFLNNDTLVPPGTIDRLAATLEETGAAAVGPKLLHGDGTLQVAGLAMLQNQTHFERLFCYLDADLPQADIPYEPVALSGAAVLVRRSAFDAVGMFEEAFVNGSEDVDLSLKLWAAGYTCRYEPRAAILHLEGASRGKAIDGAPNDRLLQSRWAHRVGAVPRYHEPLPPLLDVRWQSATPLESAVKRCFRAALAQHAGARVVENQPGLARIAATLDRRPRLTIEHRGTGETCSVVWCAPETAAEATIARTRNALRYWVPSRRGKNLLREAGVAPERIAITRPGFPVAPNGPARPVNRAIVVARATATASRLAPLTAALTDFPVERIVAERVDDAAVRRIGAAPLVVFADTGDPWGLLGTAALAGGALVIAPPESPFLEVMPPEAYIAADDIVAAVDAMHAIRDRPGAFTDRGPRAAREIARRSPDLQSGRRVRELGRVLVHGAVDPRALAMTEAIAATMREQAALHG
jgi:GT2 family glycosyltransferase